MQIRRCNRRPGQAGDEDNANQHTQRHDRPYFGVGANNWALIAFTVDWQEADELPALHNR
jgi:hypothetical protein